MEQHVVQLGAAQQPEAEGKLELAVESYRRALQAGQAEPGDVLAAIAVLLLRLGQLDESARAARSALEHNPDLARAHAVLGAIHYHRDELGAAESELQTAVQLAPEYGTAWGNLALVQLVSGRFQDALLTYREAVALQPQDPEMRLGIARAHWAQGQAIRALSSLGTALWLRPTRIDLYLLYATIAVTGVARKFAQSPGLGGAVIVGLLLVALFGPTLVSIPLGILVAAFVVLTSLLAVAIRVVPGTRAEGWRIPLWAPLGLVPYCVFYWLAVWVHTLLA